MDVYIRILKVVISFIQTKQTEFNFDVAWVLKHRAKFLRIKK